MTETVLALPFLLLILMLIFFFGQSLQRYQQQSVLDRYDAWRNVAQAPGPSSGGPDHPLLNQTFFNDTAATLEGGITRHDLTRVQNLLLQAAAPFGDDALEYTRAILDRFPAAIRAHYQTTFDSSVPLWQRMAGETHHSHIRPGNEWKFANGQHDANLQWLPRGPYVTPNAAIRDVFLENLDSRLEPYSQQGNGLAQGLRNYYLHAPAYRGPTLDMP